MTPAIHELIVSLALLGGLVVCMDLGYRLGLRSLAMFGERAHRGIGAVDAAIYGLLGLLIGFSFSGGFSHLDHRRQLIVEEANAIGTASLRLDLLPPKSQPELRRLFHEYLESRIAVYLDAADRPAKDESVDKSSQIQRQIWSSAVAATATPAENPTRILMPALNAMFDITTARAVAMHTRLPGLIIYLLMAIALMSALLAGYGMAERKRRSWFHTLVFAVIIAATIYVVLDLEDPRTGLIRLDSADQAMLQLRNTIR
jgi:hypothetical protein